MGETRLVDVTSPDWLGEPSEQKTLFIADLGERMQATWTPDSGREADVLTFTPQGVLWRKDCA